MSSVSDLPPVSPPHQSPPGVATPRASLEPTIVPGIFKLLDGQDLGIDTTNLKGQAVPDGLVSYDDAKAHGVSRAEWDAAVGQNLEGTILLAKLRAAFAKVPTSAPHDLTGPDGVKLTVAPTRALELRQALALARKDLEQQKAAGKTIVAPVRQGEAYVAGPILPGKSCHVIAPAGFAALAMSPAEARWFFDELALRTERVVLSHGAVHYMTPAMKQALDAEAVKMFRELEAARAAGKRTLYISTFISSVDVKVNHAIAAFVEQKVKNRWGPNVYPLNPAGRQFKFSGAVGDDFMYMWQSLLNMNMFDAVRFTAQGDTLEYFKSAGQVVPSEYLFTYGDAMHSAGCRYEWNIFATLNKKLAHAAHYQIKMFYGDTEVPPTEITKLVDIVGYEKRGEILG